MIAGPHAVERQCAIWKVFEKLRDGGDGEPSRPKARLLSARDVRYKASSSVPDEHSGQHLLEDQHSAKAQHYMLAQVSILLSSHKFVEGHVDHFMIVLFSTGNGCAWPGEGEFFQFLDSKAAETEGGWPTECAGTFWHISLHDHLEVGTDALNLTTADFFIHGPNALLQVPADKHTFGRVFQI